MDAERILLVDDEQAVLDGLRRQHRKHYDVITACGSDAGLNTLIDQGPFTVVVTDYQMPGMNGTQFLAKARDHDPDMIRIMLTGQADMNAVIGAVNRGQIFRFLTKPCEPELFRGCVDAGIEQYRLRHVERDLLEQTVRGSIQVLADVLALSNPMAFGKATRIRGLVRHIVTNLKLDEGWRYEAAALLSQIGYIAIPDELVDRARRGETLTPEQSGMLARHPQVAKELLQKIPRLQPVAEIVSRQLDPTTPIDDNGIDLGGRMLAAALDFEEFLALGASRKKALEALSKAESKYDKRIVEALGTATITTNTEASQVVGIAKLRVGMVIQQNVLNTCGNLIVGQGHEVTQGSLQRLRNYADLGQLEKLEFQIHMPGMTEDDPSG